MRFNIPVLTEPINLTEYAGGMRNADGTPMVVQVWVNPPRRLFAAYDASVERLQAAGADPTAQRAAATELAAWYAEVWSQHPDAQTHCTPEDVLAMMELETDPRLYPWLARRTWDAIKAHRDAAAKK